MCQQDRSPRHRCSGNSGRGCMRPMSDAQRPSTIDLTSSKNPINPTPEARISLSILVAIAISFFVSTSIYASAAGLVFLCKPDAFAVQGPMHHTARRCLVRPDVYRTLDVAAAVLNINRFKAHSRMGSSNTPFQPVWGVWPSIMPWCCHTKLVN